MAALMKRKACSPVFGVQAFCWFAARIRGLP